MAYIWIVGLTLLGIITLGILFVRASRLKRRNLFIRDVFLFVLAPVLLFIIFIELVVVPVKGAQYASSIYPIFICWLTPAMLIMNRRLKTYYD